MTFAQPIWFALLPLAVPLVLLLHARRRRDVPTANLTLWRQVPATVGSVAQRRRVPWREPSLWLQVLAVVVATTALAGPVLGADRAALHWVVVVDGSSSMNAVDVEPTRFGAAIEAIRARWVDGAIGGRVSLISAGPKASVVAAGWGTGSRLATGLERLEPSDGAPDWAGAAERASALVLAEDARVVVFTDPHGATAARAAFGSLPSDVGLDVVVLGGALVNVGIGDVAVEPRGERVDQWTVRGRVATVGFGRGEEVRVVAAYRPFGGDAFLPWGGVDVALGADGTATFELPLDLPGQGELELRGPAGDRLASDDRVVVPLRVEPRRVLVVGPRPPALMRALAAIGDLEVYASDALPEAATAAALDLVIVTGEEAGAGAPATSTLWLGAVPAGTAAGEARTGLPPLGVGPHVLVQDVDPGAFSVARAVPLRALEGATPLLTAGDELLAWARTTDVGRQVVVGFGLDDGDWSAQLSFPAFVAAVVDWATPRSWSHDASGCRVGERCPWPAEAFAGAWTLRDPSGAEVARAAGPQPIEGDPLARAVWDAVWFDAGFVPRRAGRYALVLPDGVVGLPAVATPVGGEPDAVGDGAPDVPVAVVRDLVRWFAAAAALLVLVDAWWAIRSRVRGVRRRGWPVGAWTLAALAAWALAALAVPVPVARSGGTAVWVGAPERLGTVAAERAGWASRSVALRPVGSPPSEEPSAETADWNAGDLATALELALAVPDDGGARRVVVEASEGAGLRGVDAAALSERARAQGVVVDVRDAGEASGVLDPTAELTLEQVRVPDRVQAGSRFALSGIVRAPEDAPWRWSATLVEATQVVTGDPDAVEPASGALEPTATAEVARTGPGSAELELQAAGSGTLRYRLALWGADALAPVVETDVVVTVGGSLKVLVVAQEGGQGARLVEALTAQAIDVHTVTPFRLPNSLEALGEYDAIALVNVAASELFTAYQEMLEAYVRDLGRGLLVFGGPRAFGPGGYFRTPLEDLSPLSAQITEDAPEVAMAFVLDRSGSMNGAVGSATRMDVAKVATLEALALLGEQSQAALVVFDTEAQTLVPFRSVLDVATFEGALTAVDAAGGTAIQPGLLAAYELMRGSEAATRHVVVLTDGLSQEGDFATVLGALRDLGVSTSFVGVGDAADRRQLTTLANLAGGTLHMALDFRALPSLLAQEALMLSATPIEERATASDWTSFAGGSFLDGLTDAPPPLLAGYVKTTAKDDATVHLVDRLDGDPLLASWRYGLGRVVAFASEADGPWTTTWQGMPTYGRLWSQSLRWAAERSVRETWSLSVAGTVNALDVEVVLPEPDPELARSIAVELRSADGTVLARRSFEASGDGRGIARFEIAPGFVGEFVVHVPAVGSVGLDGPLTRRIAWPLEHASVDRTDVVSVARLALATGGVVGGVGEVAFDRVAPLWRLRPWPHAWLVVGLVAFLIALGARYGAWTAWTARLRRVR
jgi:Mg-chelatase subunit ChlD